MTTLADKMISLKGDSLQNEDREIMIISRITTIIKRKMTRIRNLR